MSELITRLIAETRDTWMTDADYAEYENLVLTQLGSTMDKDLDTGLANGHSLEFQEHVARALLRVLS